MNAPRRRGRSRWVFATSGRIVLASTLVALLAFVIVAAQTDAFAQRFDPRRPKTLIVGDPSGFAVTDRTDARRSGTGSAPLPTGNLRIAWRRPLAFPLERPPVVAGNGDILVVGGRGDVVTVGDDGAERTRVSTSSPSTGSAALTSDGTFVFLSTTGDVVGVRRGVLRFRVRVASERTPSSRLAPLPLSDGGFVVAAGIDLVAFDAEGNVRSRRALPEPAAAPLVSANGSILAVSATGVVYTWTPQAEPSRLGSFGGPIDDAAAFDGTRSLVAVVSQRTIAALDVERGTTTTRANAQQSVFLGPPALLRSATFFLVQGPSSTVATALDAGGAELWSLRVATFPAAVTPDGGAPPVPVPAHVGVLGDRSGSVAFAAPNGSVGVVTGCAASAGEREHEDGGAGNANAAGCVLHMLGETPCVRAGPVGPRLSAGIVGLTPAGPDAFIVACDSGTLVKVTGTPSAPAR